MIRLQFSYCATVAMLAAWCAAPAEASVIVTFTEGPTTVTVQATGSLDTSTFNSPITANFGHPTYLLPAAGAFGLHPNPGYSNFFTFSTPFILPFGSSGFHLGTWTGPDVFVIDPNGVYDDQLVLPANYVSNSIFNASGVFNGSFASLGINPTPVVMNLPGNQTISLQFATAAAVPEPSTCVLFAMLSIVALASAKYFRRRSS